MRKYHSLNFLTIKKTMKIMPPFLTTLAFFPLSAQAAPVPELPGAANAGVQLERARESMEQERIAQQIGEDEARRGEKVQGQAEDKPQAAASDLVFVLKKVETDQSVILSQEELDSIIKPYINQSITIKDLYKIVDNINNTYIQKEYMTCRAFLPPQTIHDGVVQIKLVEGRTGTVRVEGNKSTLTRYITERFPLQEGQIANTGKLNRSLQRFNGTNDMALRIKMQAGEKPDTTDYVLYAFEPKDHNVTLYMDNNGYESSGRFRYGLFYNWRSVSGIRDSLRLSYLRSKGSGAYNLGYSIPVGRQGMKLDMDYTGNQNDVRRGDLRPLGIEGKASAYSIGLRYPLVVNSSKRYELGLLYLNQKSETTLGNGQVTWLDDKLHRYNLYTAFTHYGKNEVFYHRYGLMRSAKTSMDGKSEDVTLYQLNMYWRKGLPNDTAFITRFSSQLGGKSYMSTANRFYIGGMNTVRGYEESFLGGDRGFALGTEYHFPLMKKYLQGLVFFDYGRVSGGYVISGADTLMSTGLGIAWEQNDFHANLILGKPLKKDVGGKKVDSLRVQFSLSKTF
ncbi:Hemolysin activation/secretion protein [Selenomonas ruminantium]|uniref:Hemolysin activation/secretion protein n=1 Tax=Selenomonas ruminantium TaxID=971 RepID=A0A1M6V3U8_SELRU|nr:ShlB/FhaC/HecB family hemolysin secretion/activation protein [Selenomonas ruminantium]SHK76123.1 Hemolysin activation/secretion protein [Selenomonas ruminantium]